MDNNETLDKKDSWKELTSEDFKPFLTLWVGLGKFSTHKMYKIYLNIDKNRHSVSKIPFRKRHF